MAAQDIDATSAHVNSATKPGEHVQPFRMKRDCKKGFHPESATLKPPSSLCFVQAGYLVLAEVLCESPHVMCTLTCVSNEHLVFGLHHLGTLLFAGHGGGGCLDTSKPSQRMFHLLCYGQVWGPWCMGGGGGMSRCSGVSKELPQHTVVVLRNSVWLLSGGGLLGYNGSAFLAQEILLEIYQIIWKSFF